MPDHCSKCLQPKYRMTNWRTRDGNRQRGAIVTSRMMLKISIISINSGQHLKKRKSVQEPESAQTSTKRHLSAKQRRDLKKGKPVQDDSEESDIDEVSSSINTMSLSKPKSAPKVRGKKAKMKKMKARYADQSDEERELARKLLGAKSTTAEKPTEEVPSANNVEVPPSIQENPTPIPRPPKPVVDEPLEVLFPSTFLISGPRSLT